MFGVFFLLLYSGELCCVSFFLPYLMLLRRDVEWMEMENNLDVHVIEANKIFMEKTSRNALIDVSGARRGKMG